MATYVDGFVIPLQKKNIKAYKKAINNDYEDLVESVMENDDIDDVDFAYIVFGVSLNTTEKASLNKTQDLKIIIIHTQALT